MKQLFFTLLLSLTMWASKAQQPEGYLPILEDGKVWILDHIVVDHFDPEWPEVDRYHFAQVSVKRDTVVNGVESKVVRFETLVPSDNPDRDIVLCERDRILYFLDTNYLKDWSPLLDFNFSKGGKTVDTIWEGCWKGGFIFDEEGKILCQDTWRPYVLIQEEMLQTYWIEGIGSPSLRFLTVFAVSPGDPICVLAETYLKGECIFRMDDLKELSSVSRVHVDSAHHTPTYDLHGRVVTAMVPGSIYIRDGRKFVAK